MARQEQRVRIRQLPLAERPQEKLWQRGAAALSVRELLALVLHTGTASASALDLADQLLAQAGSLAGLMEAAPEELAAVPGVGPAKAARLKAALELSRRLQAAQRGERPTVRGPADVAALLMPEMRLLDREEFRAVLLDVRHRVMAVVTVAVGHLSGALVHPREVFKECIRRSCAAVVLVHNHPSGDPTPSQQDLALTTRLVQAGQLLGIEVLDHVILGDNRHTSLKEQGLLQNVV